MNDIIKFAQLNLHKSTGVTEKFSRFVGKYGIDFALVQEPNYFLGKLSGLKGGNIEFSKNEDGVTRSGIMINKNINYVVLRQFCSGDVVPIFLEKENIIICSAYLLWDSNFPDEFIKLLEFCTENAKQLVLGCHANAHHTVWGSTNVNDRGERLLEILLSKKHGYTQRRK